MLLSFCALVQILLKLRHLTHFCSGQSCLKVVHVTFKTAVVLCTPTTCNEKTWMHAKYCTASSEPAPDEQESVNSMTAQSIA